MNLGQCWRKLRTSTTPQRRNFPRLCDCNRVLPHAALHLGVIRWRQKQNAEALSLLQKAVQLAPQSAQAHYYLGRVLEDSAPRDKSDDETTAQAIEELRTAVKLQPNFAEAQTQLGLLLQRTGDGQAAVEHSVGPWKSNPTIPMRKIIWDSP